MDSTVDSTVSARRYTKGERGSMLEKMGVVVGRGSHLMKGEPRYSSGSPVFDVVGRVRLIAVSFPTLLIPGLLC